MNKAVLPTVVLSVFILSLTACVEGPDERNQTAAGAFNAEVVKPAAHAAEVAAQEVASVSADRGHPRTVQTLWEKPTARNPHKARRHIPKAARQRALARAAAQLRSDDSIR